MANITMRRYDADLRIPEFLGLMQYGEGINADPRTASAAVNMDTPAGLLQPVGACTVLAAEAPAAIETLAMLHRRWYTGADDADVMIAAAGGALYYMEMDTNYWTQFTYPSGVTSFASNKWSWVTYEKDIGGASPVDVMILSNAEDGMIYVRGDNLTLVSVVTPKKFGVIQRYAERIWGGAIDDDPDMLVYSAPYDFTDWAADPVIPEDGAGDIQQPSWDGDSFHALVPFGSQLVAFKKNRIWRVLGLDPGEYAFKEQYGGGTEYSRAIVLYGEQIFMLSRAGVTVYDGTTVRPFKQENCADIWAGMNQAKLSEACGCVWRDKLYYAIPLGAGTVNSAVVIYDFKEGTWLYRTDTAVSAWLPTDDALYFTSPTAPSLAYTWGDNSWTGAATASASQWVGQWADFGRQDSKKSGFYLHFTLEAKAAGAMTFKIQTERKTKTKTYAFDSTVGAQAKMKRLHFCNLGRRFRLTIEGPAGKQFRFIGGLLLTADNDED